jgi:hypothetical protein
LSPTRPRPLRRAKGRVALLVGAGRPLGGVWPLEEVTGALTRLADAAVQRALAYHLAEEIRRGKLPGAQPGDEETGAGMVALAMGKMGAFELNYSSDIDLICLFDEDPLRPRRLPRGARRLHPRHAQDGGDAVDLHTGEGYVFRTDLRLRPDASVTPVCISMEAAERYYESLGRTWERAAWIKARPAPAIWRRAGGSSIPCAPSSGAGTWISPRSRTPTTCACASAATRGWAARWRWRARPEAGAGRHPRDRVLHPDPPADRRRPRPRPAPARHGRAGWPRWPARAGCRRRWPRR